MWAKLLIQLATISRGSDLSWEKLGEYCPLIEDCEFPYDIANYREDGLPLYIILGWKDWKGRPKKHKKRRYRIRLCSNPQDLRYCPVFWLFRLWKLQSDKPGFSLAEFKKGPILPKETPKTYRKNLKILFELAGVPHFSSHSFRRSGAQWATRCGLDCHFIKDIGRWADLSQVEKYVAEGIAFQQQRLDELGVETDPILEFWIFNAKTKLDSMAMMSRTMGC
jgi:hypothetical protein